MTKLKMSAVALGFIFVFSAAVSAQTPETNQSAKSYDVLLQVLVSTGGAADLPSSLAPTSKKLKTIYPTANFAPATIIMGKTADGAGFDTRSVTTLMSQPGISSDSPTFIEFALGRLKTIAGNNFQIENFRSGMRIPLKTGLIRGAEGRETPVVTYEQIGLTVNRLTLTENSPTVIGTLTTSKPNEIIVLVLTIKSDNP
jgi:hypothetical protein